MLVMPPDYHMHTPLCRHATGEPHEYAARALELGFTEIGFSDHSPMLQDNYDDWRMNLGQLDEYVEKVREARSRHPQLTIRLALEVDFLPGEEEWVRELAARHPWDYFIGSVHYISQGWDVDNPYKQSMWKGRDPVEVYDDFYERMRLAAASGLFDFLGHADLPKKFGIFPPSGYEAGALRFLKEAARCQVPIELNTAGLRKDCHEIYPGPGLVRMAHKCGVMITFGSDAHAPEEVGYGFAESLALARKAGYTHYCRFAGRQRTVHTLPA